jgi:hypothetical protein
MQFIATIDDPTVIQRIAQRQLHLRTVLPQEGMLPGYAASPRRILTREACLRV